jgi:putative DNA primase/helicase
VKAVDFAKLLPHPPRRRGATGWWDGRCPAHDDQRDSLSFRDGDRGIIVTCHAGCAVNAIAAKLGHDVRDLFYSSNGQAPRASRQKIVTAYDYTDERGAVLYQVARYEPKDFRQRRPDGHGGWLWNMDGVRRVPYRLQELAEQTRVFVPEGEKDCDALWTLGIAATRNEGGAGKWREEHTAALVAAGVSEVVILPDNDEPGEQHAQNVAAACQAAGLRAKIVRLDDLPPKGDVSDWLAAHTAAELTALADAAPMMSVVALPPADGPVLVSLAAVEHESVEWLWPGRIARGKLALIIGEPGEGKSYVTHDVAARTTLGAAWPDGGIASAGPVIILASEDGIADTIRPRVDRQGGNANLISILRAVRTSGHETPFNLESDLAALESALATTRAVLLIADPVSAYLGSKDSYKDSEIRGILSPLAALAERYRVAIVGVLHLTKNAQRRLLLRAQGSAAFVAQARTVLAVGQDPDTPSRQLLVPIKNNLGQTPAALAFRIGDDGLVWDSAPVAGQADHLLAVDEPANRTDRRERDTAIAFLKDILANGEVASKQIETDARANGISQRTLWRAKAELGILAERGRAQDGKPGAWFWMLPVEPRR